MTSFKEASRGGDHELQKQRSNAARVRGLVTVPCNGASADKTGNRAGSTTFSQTKTMGYTTYFSGSIQIEPPLNTEEINFLTKFNETRRMNRKKGPYFVDGSGYAGQGPDADVIDHNEPPEGQPGLWCGWRVTEDGTQIEWDDGEKFYEADSWMKYLMVHFLSPNALAKPELPFLQGHTCNGTIEAQGEDSDDRWNLIVKDNKVLVQKMKAAPDGDPVEV